MATWRRAIELSLGDADTGKLRSIAQSRTEPASRVERARILLAYREDPSFFAVGRALGLHHQTVQRCVERAVAEGPMAALDDRPRSGREPTITMEAKAWLVALACRKAKDLGYPHELWTTRLLARHAREHGPAQGHACLADLAQGTVCKILGQEEVKPHKVRYYLEQRDPGFAAKMAEVLCVYRVAPANLKVRLDFRGKGSITVVVLCLGAAAYLSGSRHMSIAFCAAQSQRSYPFSCRPNLNLSSTSRPPRHSALPSLKHCWPSRTSWKIRCCSGFLAVVSEGSQPRAPAIEWLAEMLAVRRRRRCR
jgi:hypothetical protein